MQRLCAILVSLVLSFALTTTLPSVAADSKTPPAASHTTVAPDSPTVMAASLLLAATNPNASSAAQPAKTKKPHRFLTRKNIAIAVVVGCVIATAIAVPVGVHAHQQHERHAAARRALNNVIVQENQKTAVVQSVVGRIAADQQQEQQIQAILSRGKLTAAQTAELQQELGADIADVTKNRALLSGLIATNFFGQNSASIATLEAEYSEMWAQDVAGLTGYHGGASAP